MFFNIFAVEQNELIRKYSSLNTSVSVGRPILRTCCPFPNGKNILPSLSSSLMSKLINGVGSWKIKQIIIKLSLLKMYEKTNHFFIVVVKSE